MNKNNVQLANLMYNTKSDVMMDKSKIFMLKNEYKAYQCEAINEATKSTMSVIIPLELSIFVNKYLKFPNLNNFSSLDNLYEKIIENELM
jgi:hypothetical protein